MRVIIAGSRDITDYDEVCKAVYESRFNVTTVVSGGARGVDRLAIEYAKINNIPLVVFDADWNLYGKAAGYIRNELMAKNADALIALWDGYSRGTKNMITQAYGRGLSVYVMDYKKQKGFRYESNACINAHNGDSE